MECLILNVASRHNCCTNCSPLIAEIIENKEVIEECLKGKYKFSDTFKKVVLYSANNDFKNLQPKDESEYIQHLDINNTTACAIVIKAANKIEEENENEDH